MPFRAIATVNAETANPAPAKPTGTVSGDLVILGVCLDNIGVTITWPTGFTVVTGAPLSVTADGQEISCAWKIAGGSEPSTYAITCATPATAFAASFYGMNATTPIHKVS